MKYNVEMVFKIVFCITFIISFLYKFKILVLYCFGDEDARSIAGEGVEK